MDAATAMNEIRRYAVQNRIRYSRHGYDRMDERGVSREDVRHALCVAKSCQVSDDGPGRWVVPGVDQCGDRLSVVVVIESNLIVVSLF